MTTLTENLRPVHCTGPERHLIWLWGNPLQATRGSVVRFWGSPLTCGKCGATCEADS